MTGRVCGAAPRTRNARACACGTAASGRGSRCYRHDVRGFGRTGERLRRTPGDTGRLLPGSSGASARDRIGPAVLASAWLLHDLEELVAFPATTSALARRLGAPWLRVTGARSVFAVALMGVLVGAACLDGARRESALYRAVLAGLEAHVATHLLASLVLRSYTAGVVTAPLVMWPGAVLARRRLVAQGDTVTGRDVVRGVVLLAPAAAVCHGLARIVLRRAVGR